LFGRFRIKRVFLDRQLLLSKKSILAAMAYVDLNPVRTKAADSTT